MKLSLVYAHKGETRTVRFNPLRLFWLGFLVVALICSIGLWGVQQYQNLARQQIGLLSQLERSQAEPKLAQFEQSLRHQYSQLAVRVGQMQVEMTRLNALGARLIEDTELAAEFDFSATPPIGGPMLDIDNSNHANSSVFYDLSQLERQVDSKKKSLALLESWQQSHHLVTNSFISGWPAKGPGIWISSPFGTRVDPFTKRKARHKGVDIAGKEGTKIRSVGAGVVVWAGSRFGYGNLVEIEHGNGMVTRYAHAKDVLVKEGDVINKGDEIALMGSTGRSTGSHVHFEVLKNGQALNPSKFIYRKTKT
ncbi:M23 family metallopeptidase [Agarivorans sp. TSD2052]|uniref:M23 family metallopeptidase n=1 Tax=Agarivorans sp. TSD2052 TaxID=2937286 RepID=UPI00200FE982|nr:M23 family metallopeptidase [Agarivorans sp. TSD2052]UPW17935.1 M23 family metallopeptidase [Agarivorans sp. TSD2052]